MKSEKEIRQEMETLNRQNEEIRKSYKNGEIPKEVFQTSIRQNNAMKSALKWVLGENDRFD